MAIRHRRGDYNDYRPNKMLSGELAVMLQHDPRAVDGKALHAAFAPGDEKTLMTFEDAEIMIEDATEIATQEAIEYASAEAEAWAHGNGFTNNDYFSGDGTTTSFTLTYTPVSIVDVEISGSTTSAYSLSGKVLTFTTAPASGTDNIRIEYTVDTTNDNAKKYKELAVDSATSASSSAGSASTNALKSEGYAVGKQNGTDVESGSDYYHNNAKYYSDQSYSYMYSANNSAANASAYRLTSEAWAVGTKDGTSYQPTNNSKYYAEQAAAAAASLNVSAILGDFATVESSTTASQAYAVGDYLVLNSVLYKVTTAIASGGTITTSGANANVEQTNVGKEIKNRELWYPTQAIASTSGSAGTLATITDVRITADHVLTKFVAADSSYITSDITCTTSAGQAVITGTSTAATTAEIVLTKKDN